MSGISLLTPHVSRLSSPDCRLPTADCLPLAALCSPRTAHCLIAARPTVASYVTAAPASRLGSFAAQSDDSPGSASDALPPLDRVRSPPSSVLMSATRISTHGAPGCDGGIASRTPCAMYTSCVRHAHGMLAPRTLHSRATYTPRTHPALAAYTACTHGTHSMHMRRARLAHPGHTPCTCQSPTHTCAMRAPCIPHATHAILASSGHSCTPRATRATARTLLACALVPIASSVGHGGW